MNETHDRHLHMVWKKGFELDQILCEHIMHEARGKSVSVVQTTPYCESYVACVGIVKQQDFVNRTVADAFGSWVINMKSN